MAIAAAAVIVIAAALGYYDIIPLLSYSETAFYSLYEKPYLFLIPVALFVILWIFCFRYIRREFYLDQGLEAKKSVGKTENIAFLNKYGVIGTFINNDIKMLKRNKVTRGILLEVLCFFSMGC